MKIQFQDLSLRKETLRVIAQANIILEEYVQQGFVLTLRQLYYQFVARGLFSESRRWRWTGSKYVRDAEGTKNALPNYKYLTQTISDGRLAGLIDWNHLEDRARNLVTFSSWSKPEEIIHSAARAFRLNPWKNQPYYVETWVEKDSLIGVVSIPSNRWRVPHYACRGYVSSSEMYSAGFERFLRHIRDGKKIRVIHLGDHDPSGIDMTRDISERLLLFTGYSNEIEVIRVALNMDQVEQYNPPSDPAKMTDSRYSAYVDAYGDESWELDALEPTLIDEVITEHVTPVLDMPAWEKDIKLENEYRSDLTTVANDYQNGLKEDLLTDAESLYDQMRTIVRRLEDVDVDKDSESKDELDKLMILAEDARNRAHEMIDKLS